MPPSAFIYLASSSPRRHELLTQIGIAHQVLTVPSPPGADEPMLDGEPAALYVHRTAREKAQRALIWIRAQNISMRPVLCADTTIIFRGATLGKPAGIAEMTKTLRTLSGQTHEVHTAIVFAHEGYIYEDISITTVRFRALTDAEIDAYCESGEPMGKAGSYAIQGRAGTFVEHISGSYSGVMGLPLFETHRLMRQAGWITCVS